MKLKSQLMVLALVLGSVFASGVLVPELGLSTCMAQGVGCPADPSQNSDTEPSRDGRFGAIGAFHMSVTDLKLPGVMSLAFTRYYNSTNQYQGPLGNGWDFSFNRYLIFQSGTTYYHTGKGYTVPLVYSPGSGGIIGAATGPEPYTLAYLSGTGGYTVSDTHGNQDIFDSHGNLIENVDRNGNELIYSRDAAGTLLKVEDPLHGRYIVFHHADEKRIDSITDSEGRTVSYQYVGYSSGTGIGFNLVTITSPPTIDYAMGIAKRYEYDSNNRIVVVIDGKGQTVMTNTYATGADWLRLATQTIGGNTSSYVYNDTANTVQFTDCKGYIVTYFTDSNSNVIKKVVQTAGLHSGEPSSYVTTCTYDPTTGNKLTQTDPSGSSTKWTYDSKCNVLSVTNSFPSGASIDTSKGTQALTSGSTFTYESRFNQMLTKTDANGNVTHYDYGTATSNPSGNLLSITYPTTAAGTPQETFTYTSLGQVLTDTAPDGTVTKNVYDSGSGYLVETIKDYGSGRLNAATQFTYDAYGNVASVKDAMGNTSSSTYNSLGQLLEKDGPLLEKEQFSYDQNGQIVVDQKQAPGGQWQKTENVYNSIDKLVANRVYTGTSAYLETTFAYDANGSLTQTTDPLGHTTSVAYDERHKAYLMTDALGKTVKCDFDSNGNTVKQTDELGHITTYAVDGLDRMAQKTLPDGSYQTWKYDAQGNTIGSRSTAGNIVSQTYDARERLLTESYGSSTISNGYDIMGRLHTITEGGTSLIYGFDALGRNTSFTDQAGRTSSYTYDLDGNRLSATYPTGVTVNSVYDASNRLTAVKDGSGTTQASYSYDLLDRITNSSLANGTTTTTNYDLLSRISSISDALNSGDKNYSYVYDNASRVTSTTEPRGTVSSSYSYRNEVTGIVEPSGSPFSDQSFVFDAAYNRTSWTLGSSTTSYTTNNLDQYTAVGSATPTWNSNGGLASFSGNSYVYDALDRLIEVDYSGGKTLYTYDPASRRISKIDENGSGTVLSTVQYHYEGTAVAVEYQSSTTWTYFGGFMRTNGTTKQWYYRDGHGSVAAVADNSGNLLEGYEYNAQGQFQITNASGTVLSTSAIANDIMYSGLRFDNETGNYFCNARFYNPTLGRFINRDPLPGAEFSQGTNLYAYCRNNFLNASDPTGMDDDDDDDDDDSSGSGDSGSGGGTNTDSSSGSLTATLTGVDSLSSSTTVDLSDNITLTNTGVEATVSLQNGEVFTITGATDIAITTTTSSEPSEAPPGAENASTILDFAGISTIGLTGSSLGDNGSLYSSAFNGNQYVDIVANLDEIGTALGPALTLGAVSLDVYSGNDSKAFLDGSLGVAAYCSPWVGGSAATFYGGFSLGQDIDGLPDGGGRTIGADMTLGVTAIIAPSAVEWIQQPPSVPESFDSMSLRMGN